MKYLNTIFLAFVVLFSISCSSKQASSSEEDEFEQEEMENIDGEEENEEENENEEDNFDRDPDKEDPEPSGRAGLNDPSAGPPAGGHGPGPAVGNLNPSGCVKSSPNYYACRYQESVAASVGAAAERTVYVCEKGPISTKLTLVEYSYNSGAKPPNALVCEIQIDFFVMGFAHHTQSFCRNNTSPLNNDSLEENLAYFRGQGYTCTGPDGQAAAPPAAFTPPPSAPRALTPPPAANPPPS